MQTMDREDWLMSQIKLMTAAIARIMFGKDTVVYDIKGPTNKYETNELYLRLLSLVKEGQINDAEDLLFRSLNRQDKTILLLALDFYEQLNALSDDELQQSHFSRQEIYDGLIEVQQFYGMTLPPV